MEVSSLRLAMLHHRRDDPPTFLISDKEAAHVLVEVLPQVEDAEQVHGAYEYLGDGVLHGGVAVSKDDGRLLDEGLKEARKHPPEALCVLRPREPRTPQGSWSCL